MWERCAAGIAVAGTRSSRITSSQIGRPNLTEAVAESAPEGGIEDARQACPSRAPLDRGESPEKAVGRAMAGDVGWLELDDDRLADNGFLHLLQHRRVVHPSPATLDVAHGRARVTTPGRRPDGRELRRPHVDAHGSIAELGDRALERRRDLVIGLDRGCTISMTASVPQTRSFMNVTACCRNSTGSVLPISTWPSAGQNDSAVKNGSRRSDGSSPGTSVQGSIPATAAL